MCNALGRKKSQTVMGGNGVHEDVVRGVCKGLSLSFGSGGKKRLIKVSGRVFPKVNGPIKMSIHVTNSFEARL